MSDIGLLRGFGTGPKACIDENLDMVKFLVENGASVNQQDNEGWTPLHAVASCGYLNIAEYLLRHGANVAAVNSEGEVPSDLAEEAAMKDLLLEQVKKQGVDLDLARKEEEQQMLQDARQWLNCGKLEDIKQPRSGATALHVAAAKGYSEVMRLLIQAGFNLNVQDNDGWTPLHAAAHWGVKEACTILAEALCDMDIRNKLVTVNITLLRITQRDRERMLLECQQTLGPHAAMLSYAMIPDNVLLGQTPFDVADEGLVEHLEMLQKKQNVLRSEKETRNKLIEADMNGKLQSGLFKNKEKILYEEDTLKSREPEEENKESSSSSSEEEEEAEEDEASESDAEKEAERKKESFANHSGHEPRTSVTEQIPPPEHNSFTASPARKMSSSLPDEAISSSSASLPEDHRQYQELLQRVAIELQIPLQEFHDVQYKLMDILQPTGTSQDKDSKNYFAPVAPRRLSSTGDIEEKENRESAVNLVRSGSYTRQPWRDEPKGNEALQTGAPSTYVSTYLKRAPYWKQTDSTVEKNTENISASTPLGVITNRTVLSTANGVTSANATSTTGTDSNGEARERRRSYLTPVRDEEAESLRKARSRQARQTRRSTQGVTLTDLQEAERTFSRSRVERQAQEQQSEKPESTEDSSERREDTRPWWNRNQDEESVYRRLRCPAQTDKPTTPVSPSTSAPSLYTSSHLARTSRSLGPDSLNPEDFQSTATEMEKNECEDQDLDDRSPNKQSIRERRRPKERRRGTGISFWTKDDDEVDGNEEVKESRLSSALLLQQRAIGRAVE
ncbi:Protein phosphatase 1 regulatory subunit 12B [Chelonia mydas]|uniref:Protein phosphatase 1 regulatory subunit n=1 Tax=Chelonia mydas TaxID=8469 RepID=M7CJ26_CHEMY|nr:Protein phosphatase 1 regulatory subunit 12B [Chelonia mydas]